MIKVFTPQERNIIFALSLLLLIGLFVKIIKEKVFPDSTETLKLIAVSEEIKSNYSDVKSAISIEDSIIALININESDATELVSLPGVGTKLAEKIIQTRNQLNGFKTIEDLLKVPGIGIKKFQNIHGKVTL
ncbi:MAG: helix-hairpin-helix domain-containing protein [Candidatus Marinimicrobia bacterium]|nr:helix-hairpin-helix domain-containing protein [Candidatus Neomarinimicrobiota bacterium]MBT3633654.1 helix-hairpin-helix domain-containing protein [Candidatus Neomarinimicrobiota bacterium]MBT3682393.1 helix-hairpin-helix domain-containing protein [Candidatus Neomarinimicrobiota bacterium]MBT3759157.1 helix-hairpin-helix domain-containing protein [Candidatus Neomarinimicrobiota bacterium]MBT3895570.1 helix-hairpin-helix domain-containing protein [Candidatus Neomarinimicrobiota bacterium]